MTNPRPRACMSLNDLNVGDTFRREYSVTDGDVQKFGEISGDFNPAHFDEAYAKGTVFKGRIAHGMLSTSYLSTVLGTKLPGPGSIFMSANVRFKAPVRIGDTVTATCTVREVDRARRRVTFDCICRVGETVVVEGEALIMVPSREGRRPS